MIEKMFNFSLLVKAEDHINALKNLRKLGVMHINGSKRADSSSDEVASRISIVDKNINLLSSLNVKENEELSLADSSKLSDQIKRKSDELSKISEKLYDYKSRLERQINLGSFDNDNYNRFYEAGLKLKFYFIEEKALDLIKDEEYVVVNRNKSTLFIMIINQKSKELDLRRFIFDSLSNEELSKRIDNLNKEKKGIEDFFKSNAKYLNSIKALKLALLQNKEFIDVKNASNDYDHIIQIVGYVPLRYLQKIKDFSEKYNYGYIVDDIGEDEEPPTLVNYKKGVGIISPVFKIIDSTPGYREKDISLWFLLFFIIFFAMILGDGGYGLIFFGVAVGMRIKKKAFDNASVLLLILSSATIVWGALTGTWFASTSIINNVKFLQYFVIEKVATYWPNEQGIWVSSTTSGPFIMELCFILGVTQLSLAYIINFITEIKAGIKVIAQLGWLIITDALFLLALNLVLNHTFSMHLILYAVLLGLALVLLFGKQEKGQNFFKGIAKGLGDFLSIFLDTVSGFSNIISYIRLFAVGLAGVSISQSFNNMAGPLMNYKTFIFAFIILFIGHAMNIVMNLLSVIVHGVRLNLLEFSGTLSMQWSGVEYNPFRIKSPILENEE